jgi:hypothetical protein
MESLLFDRGFTTMSGEKKRKVDAPDCDRPQKKQRRRRRHDQRKTSKHTLNTCALCDIRKNETYTKKGIYAFIAWLGGDPARVVCTGHGNCIDCIEWAVGCNAAAATRDALKPLRDAFISTAFVAGKSPCPTCTIHNQYGANSLYNIEQTMDLPFGKCGGGGGGGGGGIECMFLSASWTSQFKKKTRRRSGLCRRCIVGFSSSCKLMTEAAFNEQKSRMVELYWPSVNDHASVSIEFGFENFGAPWGTDCATCSGKKLVLNIYETPMCFCEFILTGNARRDDIDKALDCSDSCEDERQAEINMNSDLYWHHESIFGYGWTCPRICMPTTPCRSCQEEAHRQTLPTQTMAEYVEQAWAWAPPGELLDYVNARIASFKTAACQDTCRVFTCAKGHRFCEHRRCPCEQMM